MRYFHISNKIVFLFEKLRALSLWDHLLLAGVVLFISILQELLVAYLSYLSSRIRRKRNKSCRATSLILMVYQLSFILRYLLMLVVMIHSTLLFAAVVLGSAFGYFILPPNIMSHSRKENAETQNWRQQDNNDEMQVLSPNTDKEEHESIL